jgi:hypothetical protein
MTELCRGVWVVVFWALLNNVSDRFRIVASLTFPLLFLAIFGGLLGGDWADGGWCRYRPRRSRLRLTRCHATRAGLERCTLRAARRRDR